MPTTIYNSKRVRRWLLRFAGWEKQWGGNASKVPAGRDDFCTLAQRRPPVRNTEVQLHQVRRLRTSHSKHLLQQHATGSSFDCFFFQRKYSLGAVLHKSTSRGITEPLFDERDGLVGRAWIPISFVGQSRGRLRKGHQKMSVIMLFSEQFVPELSKSIKLVKLLVIYKDSEAK